MWVNDLAVQDSLLFAAVVGGGIYGSTDWGDTWQQSLINPNVTTIVGTDSGWFAGTMHDGVFCSFDNGATWEAPATTISSELVDDIVAYRDNTGRLRLIAQVRNGNVFMSNDAGAGWVQTTWGSVVGVARDAQGDAILLAGRPGVRRSTDDGSTWTTVNTDFDPGVRSTFYANADSEVFAFGEQGLFLSSDGGASWVSRMSGLLNTNIWSFATSSAFLEPMDLYAGTAGGIFRSSDHGETWVGINDRLSNTSVYSLVMTQMPGGQIWLFAATDGGIAHTRDFGSTWTLLSPPVEVGSIHALAGQNLNAETTFIFAGGTKGVFRSGDYGTTWSNVTPLPPNYIQKDCFSLCSSDSVVYAGMWNGVYASSDCGGTWRRMSPSRSTYNYVLALSVIPQGSLPDAIVAASYLHGIYLSLDGGSTWEFNSSGMSDSVCDGLAAIDTTVFAGSDGIYKMQLHQSQWTLVYSDSTIEWVNCLVAVDSQLYAGTSNGILHSTDFGETWTKVNLGLPYTNILSLAGIPIPDTELRMFAGTDGGGGIWRRSFPLMSMLLSAPVEEQNFSYAISQNYPNPFNPSTVIRYGLPVMSFVTLRIYNILGQSVRTLQDGIETAGYKNLEWNAGSLASGIYFYRLDATSVSDPTKTFMQTRKMILLK
jgi:hypothetical protein